MSVLESRNNLSDRKTKAAPRLYVGSEVGTLRRVLLHRPGLELKRLTPANKDQLLFDDVLWVKRARQEHDAFADALAEAGVEVLYLQELLAHVLTDADVRTDFIEDTFQAARHADLAIAVPSTSRDAVSCLRGVFAQRRRGPMSTGVQTAVGKFVWHDHGSQDPATATKFYADLFGWEYETF